MKLRELVKCLNRKSIYNPRGFENIEITSICHDSRKASGGCIFVCRTGVAVDGHDFAQSAYKAGARVFVAQKEIDIPKDALIIYVDSTIDALNTLCEVFYNYPAKELKLVGITGTKGKTTIALSVFSICNKFGINTGYIGTNGIIFGGKTYESVNTTPDVLEMQKHLRAMANAGVEVCIIEVSSQALWQNRIFGLEFESCAFTNLYHDHIGGVEHPTMEHYRDSKKKLFDEYGAKNLIINADSDISEYMIKDTSEKSIIRTSATGNNMCDIYAQNPRKSKRKMIPGVRFDLYYKSQDGIKTKSGIFLPFPGLFNIENALHIIAICTTLGISINFAVKSLSTLSVAGRSEFIVLDSKPKTLFVIDYAHNGASLEKLLLSAKEYTKNRIIVLLGSVGGRTYTRRGELGRAARDLADVSIITSDNPNFEEPMAIIEDIAKEFNGSDKEIHKIANRQDALRLAFEIAKDGDTVIFAGKGHENYQLICGEKIPFSEKEILFSLDKEAILLSEAVF